MGYRAVFAIALFKFIVLFLASSSLSISAFEAIEFFEHTSLAGNIAYYFCAIFGVDDLIVRVPFLLLHLLSILLIYEISRDIIARDSDRVLAVFIFAIIPGVNFSAIIVNKAGVIVFLTLVFLLLLQRGHNRISYLLLSVFAMLDNAFAILFLALLFFSIKEDKKELLLLSLVLFAFNMYMFGFDSGGKPKSMFLDTFAVYMAIFSPLAFVYFIYAIYKSFRMRMNSAVVYISFWALVFSLLLSIRQKIHFEDFAPFVVLSVLFIVPVFFSSYRSRLRPHRRPYKLLGYAILSSIFIISSISLMPKLFYPLLERPHRNFAYDFHIAKELAEKLKNEGIGNIKCEDKEMQIRLKFYGIGDSEEFLLSKKKSLLAKRVSIIYTNVEVGTFYVTKINTF